MQAGVVCGGLDAMRRPSGQHHQHHRSSVSCRKSSGQMVVLRFQAAHAMQHLEQDWGSLSLHWQHRLLLNLDKHGMRFYPVLRPVKLCFGPASATQ